MYEIKILKMSLQYTLYIVISTARKLITFNIKTLINDTK